MPSGDHFRSEALPRSKKKRTRYIVAAGGCALLRVRYRIVQQFCHVSVERLGLRVTAKFQFHPAYDRSGVLDFNADLRTCLRLDGVRRSLLKRLL